MDQQEVYVVLDDFEGDLWALSRDRHVWIVESEANRPFIAEVWKREVSFSVHYGVTYFRPGSLYDLLLTIDEHNPDWKEMMILGADTISFDVIELESILDLKLKVVRDNYTIILIRRE
jgi:hypothetical protein